MLPRRHHTDAANDVFSSVQLYRRLVGYAEIAGLPLDFDRCIADIDWRTKQNGEEVMEKRTRGRKTKTKTATDTDTADAPAPAKKEVQTVVPGSTATPRQQEAWCVAIVSIAPCVSVLKVQVHHRINQASSVLTPHLSCPSLIGNSGMRRRRREKKSRKA